MPDDPSTYRTPPEIARRLGVGPEKVLAWIRSGELAAVNLATTRHGRPR
jgi:excisionase family DNA binding protein